MSGQRSGQVVATTSSLYSPFGVRGAQTASAFKDDDDAKALQSWVNHLAQDNPIGKDAYKRLVVLGEQNVTIEEGQVLKRPSGRTRQARVLRAHLRAYTYRVFCAHDNPLFDVA